MSDDRRTIGLTPNNKKVMGEIMPKFNEQMDAAKFAMALAIEEGHEPGKVNNADTVWNVGSFDPEGELRDLVIALYPDIDSPYLAVEYFVNQGFQVLDRHLSENKELNIVELI